MPPGGYVMHSILFLNSKGGSGKTTLSTNLAAYYALRGKSVTLVDFDQQRSAMDWLAARPENRAPIHGIDAHESRVRVPAGTDYVIIDSPAAVHGKNLGELVRRVQTVVVPVLPSPIDLRAALRLHEELMHIAKILNKQVMIGTVANRVREISPSRYMLEDFLRSLRLPNGRKLPFIACLRNSQNYVHAAGRGLGLWEMAPSKVQHDLELWRPLIRWTSSKRSIPES